MLSNRNGIFAGAAVLVLSGCSLPDTQLDKPVTEPHSHGATYHIHEYNDTNHRHEGISECWHGSAYDPKPGCDEDNTPLASLRRIPEDFIRANTNCTGRDGSCTHAAVNLGATVAVLVGLN